MESKDEIKFRATLATNGCYSGHMADGGAWVKLEIPDCDMESFSPLLKLHHKVLYVTVRELNNEA